ncbi:MAG: hypothetical protein JWQ25_679 [Daejeonella sp.]|nr:hypothetical protein [Daejeonella sp.]
MKIVKYFAISCVIIIVAAIVLKLFNPPALLPTGFYKLENKPAEKGGDTSRYEGSILVKQITKSKVAITFIVKNRTNGDRSRSFMDTLDYKDDMATYRNNDSEQSCRITMRFSPKGVRVIEQTGNSSSGCGYGHEMVTDGFFKKVSSEVPVLNSLEMDEN